MKGFSENLEFNVPEMVYNTLLTHFYALEQSGVDLKKNNRHYDGALSGWAEIRTARLSYII